MASTSTKAKVNYVDGVSLPVMRKVAFYEFGAYLIGVYPDEAKRTFYAVVQDGTPQHQIIKFSQFWKINVQSTEARSTVK